MLRIVVILIILAVAAIAMIVWAQRRDITDLSSQDETGSEPPVRDRPAGPEAETMDPDELGGNRTR